MESTVENNSEQEDVLVEPLSYFNDNVRFTTWNSLI